MSVMFRSTNKTCLLKMMFQGIGGSVVCECFVQLTTMSLSISETDDIEVLIL